MSEKYTVTKPAKEYISAVRFSKAVYCGRLGRWYSDDNRVFANKGMQRGSEIHQSVLTDIEREDFPIDSFASTARKAILDHIQLNNDQIIKSEYQLDTYFPFRYIPSDQAAPDSEVSISLSSGAALLHGDLPVKGFVDLLTRDAVYELKTGKEHEWHKWQSAFYAYFTKRKKAYVVYPDIHDEEGNPIIREVDLSIYKITDELLSKVWSSILRSQPTKTSLCVGCPIKSSCDAWVGEVSESMLLLTDIRDRLQELRTLRDILLKPISEELQIIDEEIKLLTDKYEELLEDIKTKEAATYKLPGYTIQIYETTKKTLPQNIDSLISYATHPHLFKPPELKKSEAIKEFGVEQKVKAVKISEVK